MMAYGDHMNANEKTARRSCFMLSANHIHEEGLPNMQKRLEFECAGYKGEVV